MKAFLHTVAALLLLQYVPTAVSSYDETSKLTEIAPRGRKAGQEVEPSYEISYQDAAVVSGTSSIIARDEQQGIIKQHYHYQRSSEVRTGNSVSAARRRTQSSTSSSPLPSSSPSSSSFPSLQPSSNSLLSLDLTCSYKSINDDGEESTEYSCESLEFSQLRFEQCEIDVQYTYKIRNRSNNDARLDAILDESLIDVFDHGQVRTLEKSAVTDFQTMGVIDICQGDIEINKKFVAIATPLTGGGRLPYVEDNIDITTP